MSTLDEAVSKWKELDYDVRAWYLGERPQDPEPSADMQHAVTEAADAIVRAVAERAPYPQVWLVWHVQDDGRVLLQMTAETKERADICEKNLRSHGLVRVFVEETVMNHLYGDSIDYLVKKMQRKEP